MDDKKKNSGGNMLDGTDGNRRAKWILRALSLLIASILWFFVSWDGTTVRSKDLTVPLRYLDIPDGYTLSERVQNVDVKIEGSLETLALLDRNAITASVSLQELRPGKYRLPVHLNSPARVRVASYTPQDVEFELYRIIERTLKPFWEIDDEDLPEGAQLTEVVLTPDEVVVKGSETEVMAVRRAILKDGLPELIEKGYAELLVELIGANGDPVEGLKVEPGTIRVSARLSEPVGDLSVPVRIPVRGLPGDGLDVRAVVISPDTVTLRGPQKLLENITELTLNPIDVTGHTEDMNFEVPIESPEPGITIPGVDHVRVSIQLHSSVEARTFLGVRIAVQGKGAFERWRLSPPVASVTVEREISGTPEFEINNPPLALYVDVTNVVADSLVLPVLVENLKDGIKVIRIEPQQVTVTAVTN